MAWWSQQGRQDSNLQPPVLETGALPVELLPWVARPNGTGVAGKILCVHRRALGVLFVVLAAGFAAIAVFAALHGGQALVIAAAATVLAFWMASLARRAL